MRNAINCFMISIILIVAPFPCFIIKICDGTEDSSGKKVIFYKTYKTFHSSFGEWMPGSKEINANGLKNIKITLFKNNETIVLKEGVDYKIDVEGGDGRWYQYCYTIFKKNFEDDGVYRLTTHSEDIAGNIAENTLDTKNAGVSFGVDKTKPNILVENLESGTTYALENLTVSMSVNDNLLLESATVYLNNYSKEYKRWTAEEILAADGKFTFDVPGDSTSAHKVKIVCVDAAGNERVEEINGFFVTTNLWVRYYTNKPLFVGSIAGVIIIAGMIVFLVVYKKKSVEKNKR